MIIRTKNEKLKFKILEDTIKKKWVFFYFLILFSFFFIILSAEQSNVEVINSKYLYRFDGVLIPSYAQNGKFNTILILDSGIEKILIDKSELDIIDNVDFKLSFFVLPLNNKKSSITIVIQKNGKLLEYQIPVIEKDPYPKSEIILDNSKKEIVSSKNTEKREEESKFFNNLLNTKSNLRYFTLPFINPLEIMKIVSVFGNSRVYKDLNKNILYTSTHLGVDLKASENTKVYAISTARVAFAGYSITRGNCIYLDHGYGLYSSYFHLNKLNVKEGQIVFAGDLIGYSGSTGISTGPHLHLGATFLGINLDPISLINEMNEIEENYSRIKINQSNK